MNPIEHHTTVIEQLCYQHKVRCLYAFGSVLTTDFGPTSDIDFVVDFEPLDISRYADNYFSFKFALEDTLQRSVDLLEEKAIKNPFLRKAIEDGRQLIYAHRS